MCAFVLNNETYYLVLICKKNNTFDKILLLRQVRGHIVVLRPVTSLGLLFF